MQEIMDEEKSRKIKEAASQAAADYGTISGAWISKGLVVKVMAKQLHDYYKKKGAIVRLHDPYVAEVEMLDTGDVIRIDQAQLETVCQIFDSLLLFLPFCIEMCGGRLAAVKSQNPTTCR